MGGVEYFLYQKRGNGGHRSKFDTLCVAARAPCGWMGEGRARDTVINLHFWLLKTFLRLAFLPFFLGILFRESGNDVIARFVVSFFRCLRFDISPKLEGSPICLRRSS